MFSLIAVPDIDECQDSPCHAGASCKDTMGSFECQCRDGLVGDGISNCVGEYCTVSQACFVVVLSEAGCSHIVSLIGGNSAPG